LSKDITVFLNLSVESKEIAKVTDDLVKLPEVVDAYEVLVSMTLSQYFRSRISNPSTNS